MAYQHVLIKVADFRKLLPCSIVNIVFSPSVFAFPRVVSVPSFPQGCGGSVSMEPLRSNVWSAETLERGVHHANSQRSDMLALDTYSDEALHSQLQDRLPTLTVFLIVCHPLFHFSSLALMHQELKAEVAEDATVFGTCGIWRPQLSHAQRILWLTNPIKANKV